MNTLTVQEIAAGGGVFEGRYAQTLAQAIVDIQQRLDDQESVCEGEGVSLEGEILNLRAEVTEMREAYRHDPSPEACTHPPDCERCNWCGYVRENESVLAARLRAERDDALQMLEQHRTHWAGIVSRAESARDDARREREEHYLSKCHTEDECLRLEVECGELQQALRETREWLGKNGGHKLGCVRVSTPQLRCSCGFIEAMGTA